MSVRMMMQGRQPAAGGGGGGYVAEVLADSPTGLWLLDETSGTTAADSGSAGIAGTYTGSYSLASRTVAGQDAPDFTGGYVNVPDNDAWSPSGGDATVELLFRLDDLSSTRWLLAKGNSNAYEWGIAAISSGAIYVAMWSRAGNENMAVTTSSGLITTGVDYHLAVTMSYSAPRLEVWVDGVSAGNDTSSAGGGENQTSPLQIGRRPDGAANNADGALACAAYYSSVLSSTRIQAHAAAAGV